MILTADDSVAVAVLPFVVTGHFAPFAVLLVRGAPATCRLIVTGGSGLFGSLQNMVHLVAEIAVQRFTLSGPAKGCAVRQLDPANTVFIASIVRKLQYPIFNKT
ncbi:hypothetical protein D3C73_1466090 [compost metagenome]